MRTFPFSAVVGADDMAMALILTAVSPEVGGVLVRGEKGTAKSTMVRALAAVLPDQHVVAGCRFGCDPDQADPHCPDGPHQLTGPEAVAVTTRPARLVELPVGASEDRVMGSLDLGRALGSGEAAYDPGLLAAAHRGILYVDEVNLLHDHLVDLLLDAAAMGRATVERDGVSVSHAARLVLVGTMNPEEGELRPQLLDRFGLTVEVSAPRDPQQRAEVVRRRLAFDADPAGFQERFAQAQRQLQERIVRARQLLPDVHLSDPTLVTIARVCAGFEVDGMRADLVTARAAVAHAAWAGRTRVTRSDVRAAARLALPHRRRRNPFDAPGLDEDLLDQLLGDDDPDQPPEPDEPDSTQPPETPPQEQPQPAQPAGSEADPAPAGNHAGSSPPRAESGSAGRDQERANPSQPDESEAGRPDEQTAPVAVGVAAAGEPRRARLLRAPGVGVGEPGRRSRARTSLGRTVSALPEQANRDAPGLGGLHLPATVRAAARQQRARGRTEGGRLRLHRDDLHRRVAEGQESNLVVLCVDASGSMAAQRRMEAVKTATLSLLLDAYRRRDKVALVSFRGAGAVLDLPATSSVEVAALRLRELPHGGRTPLAEGLMLAARTIEVERIRDPRRRPLLVVITDGHATSGPDAVGRANRVADHLRDQGVAAVVVDCERGRVRWGLAAGLATRLGAEHVPVQEVVAEAVVGTVRRRLGADRGAVA